MNFPSVFAQAPAFAAITDSAPIKDMVWKTTFTLSEPLIDAFIIGNAQYGIIGTSVMTY